MDLAEKGGYKNKKEGDGLQHICWGRVEETGAYGSIHVSLAL
jgi:hypothetical protein